MHEEILCGQNLSNGFGLDKSFGRDLDYHNDSDHVNTAQIPPKIELKR